MKIKNLFLAGISLVVAIVAGGKLTAFDKAGVTSNVSVTVDTGHTNEL